MALDSYTMFENPFRLDGFVVVITGGAGAIGSAAGRAFAHQGTEVVISDLCLAMSPSVLLFNE